MQFSCHNLSADSEYQEIDFLSEKAGSSADRRCHPSGL